MSDDKNEEKPPARFRVWLKVPREPDWTTNKKLKKMFPEYCSAQVNARINELVDLGLVAKREATDSERRVGKNLQNFTMVYYVPRGVKRPKEFGSDEVQNNSLWDSMDRRRTRRKCLGGSISSRNI